MAKLSVIITDSPADSYEQDCPELDEDTTVSLTMAEFVEAIRDFGDRHPEYRAAILPSRAVH